MSGTLFAPGVIARVFDFDLRPVSSYGGPVIAVPDDLANPAQQTKVFTAYLDLGGGKIEELLRATVLFEPPPVNSVKVLSWSVLV